MSDDIRPAWSDLTSAISYRAMATLPTAGDDGETATETTNSTDDDAIEPSPGATLRPISGAYFEGEDSPTWPNRAEQFDRRPDLRVRSVGAGSRGGRFRLA